MGSPCSLSLYVDRSADPSRLAVIAIDEVRRIEKLYSRYTSDSVLAQINRVAENMGAIVVDDETADLVDHAFRAHALSDGLFDITSGLLRGVWKDGIVDLPDDASIAALVARVGLANVDWERPRLAFKAPGMELDFGGIGKEYAADRAVAALRSAGVEHGLVDLGGDIALVGAHPDGSSWRVGVRDPMGEDKALATLFVKDGGIATSGSYERYFEIAGRRFSHVLNPKTGWPVEGLPSATVAAETCLAAGVASTIALLKGEAGARWLRDSGAIHLYVDASGRLGGSIPLSS
jgi:thiamine biosynthesis lipoprotein